MALYSDPQFDQLMFQYFENGCNPQSLYQGSQEDIIEVLKAWVIRRKAVYKDQMELRDQSQKSAKLVLSSPNEARNPRRINELNSETDRSQVLDSQASIDCLRATYLLHTLKFRGITWPELWWQPNIDGGVCSFLGTVDKEFDAHATLTILEDKEEEERLQATAAEIQAQFKALKAHGFTTAFRAGFDGNNGPAEGSEKKKSTQEERAEARAEAKGKAKESKQKEG